MLKTQITLLALVALFVAAAPAKPAAKPTSKTAAPAPLPAAVAVRQLEGIREYRLANGLQILLFSDPASTTTLVNLVYRVGSRHEGAGEAGMAHLLEHLLFKGTPSVADIPKSMSERGVRFNATTSTDRTNYFSAFNANAETLTWVLRLEAERMQRSRVESADLAKEMPVVMNELQQGENQPMQLLRQRLQAAAFRFHPYGRPTIGTKSDVENVPIEALRRFYQAHYRPDNATLIVAGAFDEATLPAQINQLFGRLANPAAPKPASYTVEPAQDGERSIIVRRVGGSAVTLLGYHAPPFAHADCAALALLGPMLMQPPSGALYKRFVESDKTVAQLGGGGCGGHDAGLFNVIALHSAGSAPDKLEAALLKALEQEAAGLLDAEQFARMQSQFALAYSQLLKQPQQVAQLLTEAVAAGDWRLVFKLVADIKALSLADVQRVAKTYLQANNRTLARYEPVASSGAVEIPGVADRQAGLDRLASETVSEGERLDPAPLALQRRTQWAVLPKSGLKLSTLAKKSRGDEVVGEIRLRWGDAQALVGADEAGFVASLLREGNARYSRQQLIDESTRLKGSFGVAASRQGLTLLLQGERGQFIELLRLALQVLKAPSFPTDAFARLQRDTLQSLRDSRAEPDSLRSEAVRGHYNTQRGVGPEHPNYIASLDENIARTAAVTLERVRDFHARYWSANEGEAAFVGALPEGLAAALDEELAAWQKPAAPRFTRWTSPHQAVAPTRIDVPAPDKAAAVLRLRQQLQLHGEHPDVAALEIANHILGGGSLESRLNVRLRQQGGLTYGVGSDLSTSGWDDDASWSIATSMAPENRDKAVATIQEVIATALKDGFNAAELERARKDILEGRRLSRSSDAALPSRLNGLAERSLDWRYVEAWDQRYRDVTLEQLNAVLRRHLKPGAWVISSAGDYANKAQAK